MSLTEKIAMSLAASCVASSLAMSSIVKADEIEQDKQTAKEYWSEFKQDSKQNWKDTKSAFRDGWIEGKLETALILNEHLNPFKIDIEVNDDTATLGGEVSNDIEKELAEEVALSIVGIDDVKNNIKVDKGARDKDNKSADRDLSQHVQDATITASVKTALLKSPNVEGMKIDVDTKNAEVTLSGKVDTQATKNLAEVIARNNRNVRQVTNKLEVKS
ncbi:Osmotically-inducible protein Y [Thalassocella blandensis]|nr:Osmotically-inducible protein Y [Thalassocella blandensis]